MKMAEQQQNHQFAVNYDHESEYQNRDGAEGEANTTAATTITDICNELVDRIFDFLDVQSLLNCAQTCTRLQIAAAEKFGHDFGNDCVDMSYFPTEKPEVYRMSYGQKFGNATRVTGLKYCLKFLRCFGTKISYLYLMTKNDEIYDKYVIQYVNQYCAQIVGMDVLAYVFAADEATNLFCKFNHKSLKYFNFKMENRSEWENFVDRLRARDEWRYWCNYRVCISDHQNFKCFSVLFSHV